MALNYDLLTRPHNPVNRLLVTLGLLALLLTLVVIAELGPTVLLKSAHALMKESTPKAEICQTRMGLPPLCQENDLQCAGRTGSNPP